VDVRPPRLVTLVLCEPDGTVLGALPPQEMAIGWWPEVSDVVAATRATYGLTVTVLRLLETGLREPPGGPVAYLAEVANVPVPALPLTSWSSDPIAEQPYRQTWARPGGPAAHVAWAEQELARIGAERTGPPQQIRTWNLSTLWRFPTAGKPNNAAWLKVVPPFFAHEGALMERLDPAVIPQVLATDGPRLLLAELAGDDLHEAVGPRLLNMVDLLVGLQVTWATRLDELLALGLPDWRAASLQALAERAVAACAADLDRDTAALLDDLLIGLPDRLAAVAACGVPESLVHGDFHPGNVRSASPGRARDLRLYDWGDAGVGHPMLDQAAFLQRRSEPDREVVQAYWAGLWRAAVPGCEPERAAALLSPVAALRQVVIFRMFLDHIEPDEQVYHHDDPAQWLLWAAQRFARQGNST
jgi:hypothetical protein